MASIVGEVSPTYRSEKELHRSFLWERPLGRDGAASKSREADPHLRYLPNPPPSRPRGRSYRRESIEIRVLSLPFVA